MTLKVFTDSGHSFYFVFLIITGIVGFTALVLRFVASNVVHRKLGWEDWLAAAAVAVFLARTSVGLRALVINGRYLELALDPPAYEKAFKMIFVADLITMLDQTLSKLSVCALYIRIFGVMSNYRPWIYTLAVAQIICYISLVIMQTLQCRPVHKFWQFWVQGECFPFSWILLVLEVPNSLIDFGLVGLAMVMIRRIQLQTRSMWKLRILFGLGSLAGIFGFIKIGLSYNPDNQYTTAVIGLWAAIQSTACIICCCAPVCGKLFTEWGLWSSFTVRVRGLTSFIPSINFGGPSSANRSNKTEKTKKSARIAGSSDSHQQEVPSQAWLRPDVPSAEWLVTGQSTPRPNGQMLPLRAIQVECSIDIVQAADPGGLLMGEGCGGTEGSRGRGRL